MIFSTAKEAKAAGSKTYFTGVVCKNGHLSERYAGNRECLACERARKEAKKASKMPVEVVVEKVVVPVKTVRVVVFKVRHDSRRGYYRDRPEVVSDRRVSVRA